VPEAQTKEPSPENIARSGLEIFHDTLDSFSLAFKDHPDKDVRRDASILELAAESLSDIIDNADVAKVEVRRRVVRPNDKVEEGEHPGAHIIVELSDGKTAHINLYGGIGREVVGRDIRDTDKRCHKPTGYSLCNYL